MNVTLPPKKKEKKKEDFFFQTVSEYSTTERSLDPRTSVSDSPGQGKKGGGSGVGGGGGGRLHWRVQGSTSSPTEYAR